MLSSLTLLALMALFSLIQARPMLHSRSPSPRIVPGASESLSHWLANIGMHNFNWVWDDSPSPSSSATPSSSHTPSSSPSLTPSPTLNYYDPYATYFVYPTSHSTPTFHGWEIHHTHPTSSAVHNILQTPTLFPSTYRPTATPMLSWGPRPTPSSSVRVTPTPTPTPSPTSTPTPSHGSPSPQPSKAKEEPSKDDEEDDQDHEWDSFYDSLSGRIRDALDSSDELWL